MAEKLAVVAFVHREKGTYIEGEFVVESATAWQIAVGGKVQAILKEEWVSTAPRQANGFDDIFGGMFGGSPFDGPNLRGRGA